MVYLIPEKYMLSYMDTIRSIFGVHNKIFKSTKKIDPGGRSCDWKSLKTANLKLYDTFEDK